MIMLKLKFYSFWKGLQNLVFMPIMNRSDICTYKFLCVVAHSALQTDNI